MESACVGDRECIVWTVSGLLTLVKTSGLILILSHLSISEYCLLRTTKFYFKKNNLFYKQKMTPCWETTFPRSIFIWNSCLQKSHDIYLIRQKCLFAYEMAPEQDSGGLYLLLWTVHALSVGSGSLCCHVQIWQLLREGSCGGVSPSLALVCLSLTAVRLTGLPGQPCGLLSAPHLLTHLALSCLSC